MSKHSVAEAKNRLSELIDRALNGEDVVITRHGAETVQLRPVRPRAKPVTADDLDRLAARRIGAAVAGDDFPSLVRRLRDEEQD